jgi:superfamily II DNA/RNA helicase
MARKILVDPVEVKISISKPPARIVQEAFVVFEEQKIKLVKYLLKSKDFRSVLVFCSRKSTVKQLSAELKRSGLSIEEIHSDLNQVSREQVLLDFKNRKLKILVATDILSRGIDIEDLDLVINYDVPHDVEDYIHRIGRTARAETDGIAYTLIGEKEQNKFLAIEELLGKPVTKGSVPVNLGSTPVYQPRKFQPGRSRNRSHSR